MLRILRYRLDGILDMHMESGRRQGTLLVRPRTCGLLLLPGIIQGWLVAPLTRSNGLILLGLILATFTLYALGAQELTLIIKLTFRNGRDKIMILSNGEYLLAWPLSKHVITAGMYYKSGKWHGAIDMRTAWDGDSRTTFAAALDCAVEALCRRHI